MQIKIILLFLALQYSTSGMGQVKQNVLFIVSDDLNNVIGCYGHPFIKTPNLDRLAKCSVKFNRAYTQFPWCNPSRASMLTGLRPDIVKIWDLKTHFRSTVPDIITLPELFRKNGYHTARVGKIFHYGNPGDIGTNGLDDAQSWHEVSNPKGIDKEEENLLTNYTPRRKNLGNSLSFHPSDANDELHTDGMVAKQSIELLSKNKEQPFFIAVGFYRPHCPYIAPKKYFDLYPLENIKLPEQGSKGINDIPPAALKSTEDEKDLTDIQRKELIRAYYASISFLDANVGKILDALDSLKLSDNTVIVFMSDHGYHLYEHGLWMKKTLFEQSCRVPLMISVPGKIKTGTSEAVVELLDLYPTLANLCSIEPPVDIQGRNLAPLLVNPTLKWDYPAFSQVDRNDQDGKIFFGRSIRTAQWRYTEWDEGKKGIELYDHNRDPGELVNLAQAAAHKPIIEELRKKLRQQK